MNPCEYEINEDCTQQRSEVAIDVPDAEQRRLVRVYHPNIHPLKLCHITNPTHTMANRWCELNLLECAGYSPVYEERSDFTQTLRSSYTEFYPQNQCGPLAAAQRVRDRWSGCGAGSARAHPSPRHTPACIDFGIVGYEMRVQVCGI